MRDPYLYEDTDVLKLTIALIYYQLFINLFDDNDSNIRLLA